MQIGVYTFVENTPDPATGQAISPAQRLRDLIEEIELADQAGLDVFGVGEHHRPDYVGSAPTIMLAAAAERTKRIRLSSAVTVLSPTTRCGFFSSSRRSTCSPADAPRSWPVAARSSSRSRCSATTSTTTTNCSPRSWSCCCKSATTQRVTWHGAHRAPLRDQGVYPRTAEHDSRSGSRSAATRSRRSRAGSLDLPMALAIIGGLPERFAPFVESVPRSGAPHGHDADALPRRHQLPRLHGRYVAAGDRRFFPELCGADDPHRPRARLAADHARAIRRRPLAAGHLAGRQAAGGGREDSVASMRLATPLSHADERRHGAARQDDALDRTARHEGRAGGAQGARKIELRRDFRRARRGHQAAFFCFRSAS